VGASVTLLVPSVAVQPGGEATIELRLRNTGTVVDEFGLSVVRYSVVIDTIGDADGILASKTVDVP
jgi:hypothetical protein